MDSRNIASPITMAIIPGFRSIFFAIVAGSERPARSIEPTDHWKMLNTARYAEAKTTPSAPRVAVMSGMPIKPLFDSSVPKRSILLFSSFPRININARASAMTCAITASRNPSHICLNSSASKGLLYEFIMTAGATPIISSLFISALPASVIMPILRHMYPTAISRNITSTCTAVICAISIF